MGTETKVKFFVLDTLELVRGAGIVGRIGPLFFCFMVGRWYFVHDLEWFGNWNRPDAEPVENAPR